MTLTAHTERKNPLQLQRRLQLAGLTFLFVTLSVWMYILDLPLRTEAAAWGIASFELAGNAETAGAILDSWSPSAREVAMLGLGLDYLYLVVYPVWFALLSLFLVEKLPVSWSPLGRAVAAGVLLCTPLDAIENHALIEQMMRGASDAAAGRAWYCAVPKFAILVAAASFVATASVSVLARRARPDAT